jgi:hypothetical protein
VLQSGGLVQRGKEKGSGHGIFETTTRSAGEDEESPEKDFTGDKEFRRPTLAGGRKPLVAVLARDGGVRGTSGCGKGGAQGSSSVYIQKRGRGSERRPGWRLPKMATAPAASI